MRRVVKRYGVFTRSSKLPANVMLGVCWKFAGRLLPLCYNGTGRLLDRVNTLLWTGQLSTYGELRESKKSKPKLLKSIRLMLQISYTQLVMVYF